MTKGNVLTHLALSTIQYKSTIDTSAKDTTAAAAAAAKDIGKEGGGDGSTPTWQIVDLRSMDGGFFIVEVSRDSRHHVELSTDRLEQGTFIVVNSHF